MDGTFGLRQFIRDENGILLPKLFWPTVRKNCSSDWEFFFKFEAEGWEFAKFLRTLDQFIPTAKGQKKNLKQKAFLAHSWRFLRSGTLEQLQFKLEKKWDLETYRKN